MGKKIADGELQRKLAWIDAVQLQLKMVRSAYRQLKSAARKLAVKMTADDVTADDCAVEIARVIVLTD